MAITEGGENEQIDKRLLVVRLLGFFFSVVLFERSNRSNYCGGVKLSYLRKYSQVKHKAAVSISEQTPEWLANGELSAPRRFLSSSPLSADELGEAAAASPQRHPVQADLRGAAQQHPAGHHERDVCLRGGEEE